MKFPDITERPLLADLRGTYSALIGAYLVGMTGARADADFPLYVNCIQGLWICVKSIICKTDAVTKQNEFNQLFNNMMAQIREYPAVYSGQFKSSEGGSKIMGSLIKCEEFLICEIESAGFFGMQTEFTDLYSGR